MIRRVVAFCLALLAFSFLHVSACLAAPRPHIVFMMADDLGWGDVGYHGSKISTPNIDRLAERGTHLDQFYVQPVCSPTRACLMTGRYPMRYGMQCGVVRPWAKHGLPLDERTLPQALRAAGYETAIVGKWHLGHLSKEYLPTQRGFDHQFGHYNGALDYFTHIRDGGHDWHRDDEPFREEGYTTDLIADEAVRLIAAHDQSKPLFLYVPFNAPHTPLQAPADYIARYEKLKNKQRRTYAAMVTCMDDAVGEIVVALEENKFDPQNTLIFFCSDNGGIPRLGSNRELRAGKGTLYEGGVRVPAIAVWPGKLEAGRSVDQPLHMVNMYPTLIGLAGGVLDQEKPLDGKDAWPTIAAGKPSPHDFILHNLTPFHAAIRVGDWKLIRSGHVTANATVPGGKDTWELFNIRDDVSEATDVSAKHSAIVDKLKKRLMQLASEAALPKIPPNRPPDGFQVPKVWGHPK